MRKSLERTVSRLVDFMVFAAALLIIVLAITAVVQAQDAGAPKAPPPMPADPT